MAPACCATGDPGASSSPTPTTSPTRSARAIPSTPPRRSTRRSRSACRSCARGRSTTSRRSRAACKTISARRTSPGCARSIGSSPKRRVAGCGSSCRFADYWPAYGGIAQWLAWRGAPVAAADRDHPERYAARFFGDTQLRDAYAARVRQLATRNNTITGTRYGDDPTILAWELMNEPRGAPDDWIAFAAGAVRSHCAQLRVARRRGGARFGRRRSRRRCTSIRRSTDAIPATRSASAARSSPQRRAPRHASAHRRRIRPAQRRLVARRAPRMPTRPGSPRPPTRASSASGPWLLGHRVAPAAWDEDFTFHRRR